MPHRLRIPARSSTALGVAIVSTTATAAVTLTLLATGEVGGMRAAWLLAATLSIGAAVATIVMCERRAHDDALVQGFEVGYQAQVADKRRDSPATHDLD